MRVSSVIHSRSKVKWPTRLSIKSASGDNVRVFFFPFIIIQETETHVQSVY